MTQHGWPHQTPQRIYRCTEPDCRQTRIGTDMLVPDCPNHGTPMKREDSQ